MRTVKYLTLAILLCVVLILTETNQLLYSVNFAFGSMRAYYSIQLAKDDLPVLEKIAEQTEMLLCITENRMPSTQEFDVYASADQETLRNVMKIQFGTFRSVFYQNPVQIRSHKLTEYSVPENAVKLYFVGNNQAELQKELEVRFPIEGGVTVQQDTSSMLIAGWIAWGILIVFAFFLSAFDAESKRKTCFVRIINGASPTEILLKNIGIELLFLPAMIALVSCITNCFVTVQTGTQFRCMSVLLILASMLPYIRLMGMSYRVITQERLSVSRLLNFGYIYKTLLLCMTMAVFSLTASLGAEFFRDFRVLRFAKEYEDYSIINIETTEVSLAGDIDVEEAIRYLEQTNLRIEEIYRKYYESNHALMIVPYNMQNEEQGGFIYCNANAADYIDRLFGEYHAEMYADVCIFLPDDVSENETAVKSAIDFGIPCYAGRSWETEIRYIHYHGNKTGFYISAYEDSPITLTENPVVVYVMRTPDEIGVPMTDTEKASAAGKIAYLADETMLNDLQARSDIKYEIAPIGKTIYRQFDSTKRICGALAMICAVFAALNLFVSGFLIRMEYRLRAKEYCIKTVLGYTMLQKFGSFLTMSVLSVMVSVVIVILLRHQLNISPVVLAMICGGMLIADTAAVFCYAVRTERSSIVTCLKGGAL